MREEELETTLFALGRQLAYPRPTRMADAVRARLAAPRPLPWWRRYALAPALVTAVLLFAVLLLGSPGVRAAAQEFFHLRGVDIFPVPSLPTLTPRPSPSAGGSVPGGGVPGDRVTLAEAQSRVHFTIRQPSRLGTPDAIYVDQAEHVTLVYGAAQVVEFRATVDAGFFGKLIGPDTKLEQTTVNGDPAFWLEGAPHFFFYRLENGTVLQETLRLAGNTLIWVHDGVTLRLEDQVSKDEALAIATSTR